MADENLDFQGNASKRSGQKDQQSKLADYPSGRSYTVNIWYIPTRNNGKHVYENRSLIPELSPSWRKIGGTAWKDFASDTVPLPMSLQAPHLS